MRYVPETKRLGYKLSFPENCLPEAFPIKASDHPEIIE
jgi:hypothetical protein